MKPSAPRLPIPSGDEPTGLTDWCEAQLLLSGKTYLSRAKLRSLLRNTIFIDVGEGADDLSPSDLEVAIEMIIGEVERRSRCGGAQYPFAVEQARTGVSLTEGSDGVIYGFLLLICVSSEMRVQGRQKEVDETFDLLVLKSLCGYLGPSSRGIRFGSPASGERPRRFRDAIKWLSGELALPVGSGDARSHSGDGGADIVAWVPFADKREGFLVVLAQCTVGIEWHNKGKDIIVDRWRGWVDFGKDPMTCLAVPFAVAPGYAAWDEIRRTTHLVFDRIRLVRQLADLPSALHSSIRKWVRKEVKNLGGSLRAFG